MHTFHLGTLTLVSSDRITQTLEGGVFNSPVGSQRFGYTPTTGLMATMVSSANGGDFIKTLDQIAQSLTYQLRMGAKSAQQTGSVVQTELFMRVDWPWLAYPVALLTAVRRDFGGTTQTTDLNVY
jgi:hypothetical protein